MLPTNSPLSLRHFHPKHSERDTFKSISHHTYESHYSKQNTREERQSKMGVSNKWLRIVRRKFLRSSNKDKIVLPRPSVCTNQSEVPMLNDVTTTSTALITTTTTTSSTSTFTREHIAAIKIQAYFRSHLARRAYRALRSLVKLQALVRGVCVRRQSRIAMQCMHALVRLQVRIRARQLLGRIDND